MQLFYDPDIRPGIHPLREVEAQHAARVLRKRVGDRLDLVDGRGGWFTATITEITKRDCLLQVDQVRREERRAGHRLALLIAPTKNIDRFEWILEKATEIGIDAIHPFFSEHSERTRLRNDRLERVIESAMKQSLRAFLPVLYPAVSFSEVVQETPGADKFLAYLGEGERALLAQAAVRERDTVIAIGPEGGFSPAEASRAREAGYRFASLGPHRLRTETAAITAVHTIESLNW